MDRHRGQHALECLPARRATRLAGGLPQRAAVEQLLCHPRNGAPGRRKPMRTTAPHPEHSTVPPATAPGVGLTWARRAKTWQRGCPPGHGHPPRARRSAVCHQARGHHAVPQAQRYWGLLAPAPVVRGEAAGRAGCWRHGLGPAHGSPNPVGDASSLDVQRRQRRATRAAGVGGPWARGGRGGATPWAPRPGTPEAGQGQADGPPPGLAQAPGETAEARPPGARAARGTTAVGGSAEASDSRGPGGWAWHCWVGRRCRRIGRWATWRA